MKQKPIIILDEHPNWLEPLYSALTQRGVVYRKIDISSAIFDPSQKDDDTLYVNRFSPSSAKRGHEKSAGFILNYLLHLENQNLKVINGSHTVLLETSKAYQASLLESLRIPHPKTAVVNDAKKLLEYIGDFSFPIVIKPNCGGSGMGIQKFANREEVENATMQNILQTSSDGILLLQEFIQPKDGYIVRVETINKKVVYGMKVYTQDTFNLCPSESCDLSRRTDVPLDMGYCVANSSPNVSFELYKNLPKDIILSIENLVEKANLDIAGIEYVVDKNGNWYVYDINALSILRATFKEEYGIDGWGILADFLVSEYKKII
ncbi:MAG TPA: hypothetical protein VF189_04310 [Patescibacteria group bacterium]